MNKEIEINNDGYDLYDFINLIWKNKFKMFIIPIFISLFTFIFYNNAEEYFDYQNEIFIDSNKIAQIEKELGFGSVTNIDKKILQGCRNKHEFFSENADSKNFELIKQLANNKKIKCNHIKEDQRFIIEMENVPLRNFSMNEIEQYPLIYFNFINNSVKTDIINEIRNRKETLIFQKQRELQELKNNIKIEKALMESRYISTIKDLSLHLKIAQTNNIISPQKDAPGFSRNLSMGFYNTELLYKNGVTAINLLIESIDEQYQQEILGSLTLQTMQRDVEYIEANLKSIYEIDFIDMNKENDFFKVLIFEKDNEFKTTFSKPNFNFLITLFLSFGIILVSVILMEGYKFRQSQLKN